MQKMTRELRAAETKDRKKMKDSSQMTKIIKATTAGGTEVHIESAYQHTIEKWILDRFCGIVI